MKILYIAGYGRSGSTILDNVLGQVDGFFTVGELRYIWDRGIQKNWTCGCEQAFRNCEFWTPILDSEFGENQLYVAKKMLGYRDPLNRMGGYLRGLSPRDIPPSEPYGREEFITNLKRLYSAVFEVTGAEVIIDSSKWPSYGRYLSEMSGVDLRVIHLVRDPRAVAFSWRRKKAYDPYLPVPEPVRRLPVIRAAVEWMIWNRAAERLIPPRTNGYLPLRYEDFARDPKMTVRSILQFVGEPRKEDPFVNGNSVELGQNHCVAGNPVRFRRGRVNIVLDEEWRSELTPLHGLIVRATTQRLMRKYGYRQATDSLSADINIAASRAND